MGGNGSNGNGRKPNGGGNGSSGGNGHGAPGPTATPTLQDVVGTAEPKLAGIPTREVRESLAKALTKLASQGSVPAATNLASLLRDWDVAEQANVHRQRLAQLSGNTVGLCAYLGELAIHPSEVESMLGRKPDAVEAMAYEQGQRKRILEARALELHIVRTEGKLELPEWHTTHWTVPAAWK